MGLTRIFIKEETYDKLVKYHANNRENIEHEGYEGLNDWCDGLLLEAFYGYWDKLPTSISKEIEP